MQCLQVSRLSLVRLTLAQFRPRYGQMLVFAVRAFAGDWGVVGPSVGPSLPGTFPLDYRGTSVPRYLGTGDGQMEEGGTFWAQLSRGHVSHVSHVSGQQ